jgi:hypothetical protein
MMKTLLSVVAFVAIATAMTASTAIPSLLSMQECPDRIVYGDPSHSNRFTFTNGDQERVLHFERVFVSIDPDGRHTFHVPPFGLRGGTPTEIKFTATPVDTEKYSVEMWYFQMPPGCLRIMPQRERDMEATMEVLSFDAPPGAPARLSAEIRFLTRGDTPRGLVARIETDQVSVLTSSAADVSGSLRVIREGEAETIAVDGATAVFYEGSGTLDFSVTLEDGDTRRTVVRGVSRAPQVVGSEVDGYVSLYHIQELSPSGVTLDSYGYRIPPRATEPILDRGLAELSLDHEAAEWTSRVEIAHVIVVPELTSLEIDHADGGRHWAPEAALVLDDLPHPGAHGLSRPTPGRSHFAYYPEHDLVWPRYTETVSRGENGAFLFQVQDGTRTAETEAAGVPSDPEPIVAPAVAEVMAILGEVFAEFEQLEEVDDQSMDLAAAEAVTTVFRRRGTTLGRAATVDDIDALFSGELPFFFEPYGQSVVDEAWRLYMESIRPKRSANRDTYDARLHLDAAGAPLRRLSSYRDTNFTIDYRGDHVFVTAGNPKQGSDTVTVRVPPGILDFLQVNEALSRLPLAETFERTLTFFDLSISHGSKAGIGADGQAYSATYLSADPVYVTGTIRVIGRETIEIEGERLETYRAEVFFRGNAEHPLLSRLGANLNPKGRQGEPFIYHLSVASPHRVLKVDWRDTVVQRALQ